MRTHRRKGTIGKFQCVAAAAAVGLALLASPNDAGAGTRIVSTPTGFGRPGDNMGAAVAICGDTAIAGSPQAFATPAVNSGVAQIFRNDGGGWHLEGVLVPSDGSVGEGFGSSVTVGQDIAVVGAAGRSYTFVRNGTQWTQSDELTFGSGPSLSGDTLVLTNGSVARVYVRSNGAWVQQSDLQGDLPATQGELVINAVVSGDYLAMTTRIDAPALSSDSNVSPDDESSTFAEYFFSRANGSWTHETKLALGTTLDFSLGPSVALSGQTAVLAWSSDDPVQAYVRDASGVWSLQGSLDPGATWIGVPILSVTLDGDTAVVGASGDTVLNTVDAGSAYVFTRSGGTWSRIARPYDPNSTFSAYFGTSVALSGSALIVGVPGASIDYVASGKIDAFDLSGDPATPTAMLGEGNAHIEEAFGAKVAASGSTMLVAAPQATTNTFGEGAAYLFGAVGGNWIQQAELRSPTPNALFAVGIALDGTTAAVGSWEVIGNSSSVVYVYTNDGGMWQEQQRIDSGLTPSAFGSGLALSGDTLAVGDPGWSGQDTAGRVRIFTRSASTWSEQQMIQPAESSDGDSFGAMIAMSADTMLVGAPGATVGIESRAGAAYVFVWNGSAWEEQAQLLATMPLQNTGFGQTLALSGDTVIIGATNAGTGEGSAAYVFTRSGGTWTLQTTLLDPDNASSVFGNAVGLSSDASIAVVGTIENVGPSAAYAFLRTGAQWNPYETLYGSQTQTTNADYFGAFATFSGGTAFIGAPGEVVGGAVYVVPLGDSVFANGFD